MNSLARAAPYVAAISAFVATRLGAFGHTVLEFKANKDQNLPLRVGQHDFPIGDVGLAIDHKPDQASVFVHIRPCVMLVRDHQNRVVYGSVRDAWFYRKNEILQNLFKHSAEENQVENPQEPLNFPPLPPPPQHAHAGRD